MNQDYISKIGAGGVLKIERKSLGRLMPTHRIQQPNRFRHPPQPGGMALLGVIDIPILPLNSVSLLALTFHKCILPMCAQSCSPHNLRWYMIPANTDISVLSPFHYRMVLAPVFICAEQVTEFCILVSPSADVCWALCTSPVIY